MRIQQTFGFKLVTELTLLAFYLTTISLFYPAVAQAINESQSVINLGLTETNSDVVAAIASGGTIPLPGYITAKLGLPAGVVFTSDGKIHFSQRDIWVPGRIAIPLIRTYYSGAVPLQPGAILGIGWAENLYYSLTVSGTTATLWLGNGETISFLSTDSGAHFYPPDTESTSFESITPDGLGYALDFRDKTRIRFKSIPSQSNYGIDKVYDNAEGTGNNGNYLEYLYDTGGKLRTIQSKDAAGGTGGGTLEFLYNVSAKIPQSNMVPGRLRMTMIRANY